MLFAACAEKLTGLKTHHGKLSVAQVEKWGVINAMNIEHTLPVHYLTLGLSTTTNYRHKWTLNDIRMLLYFQDELKTYISRVLDEENEKWIKGEEPSMEDDCYVSHEVFVIIQVTPYFKIYQNWLTIGERNQTVCAGHFI